jgi:hypothetical protein
VESFEGRLAADAAGTAGEKVPLQWREIWRGIVSQGDVDDVVLLGGNDFRIDTVADPGDVIPAFDDTFAVEESCRQLEVVAGRAHGDGHRVGFALGDQPDFQRLFGRQVIAAKLPLIVGDFPDPGRGLASRTKAHDTLSFVPLLVGNWHWLHAFDAWSVPPPARLICSHGMREFRIERGDSA